MDIRPGIFFPTTSEQDLYNVANLLPQIPTVAAGPKDHGVSHIRIHKAKYPDLGCNCYDMNIMVEMLRQVGCNFFIHLNDDIFPVRYWLDYLLEGVEKCGIHCLYTLNDGINTAPMSNFHAFSTKTMEIMGYPEGMYRQDGMQCYFLDTEVVLRAVKMGLLRYNRQARVIHQNHISLPERFRRENRQKKRSIKDDIPIFIKHMHAERINAYQLFKLADFQEELKELDVPGYFK